VQDRQRPDQAMGQATRSESSAEGGMIDLKGDVSSKVIFRPWAFGYGERNLMSI
jgi:hypothetical protein